METTLALKCIIRNKLLFKYIIKLGRVKQTNLVYYQISDVIWMLKNRYESLIWWKIKNHDILNWENIANSSLFGLYVIRYGSFKLFQSIFENRLDKEQQCNRSMIFPHNLRNRFIKSSISNRKHEITFYLLEQCYPLELANVVKFIKLSVENVSISVVLHLISRYNLTSASLFGHRQWKVTLKINCRNTTLEEFSQLILFFKDNRFLHLIEKNYLYKILLIANDKELLLDIVKHLNTSLLDDIVVSQLLSFMVEAINGTYSPTTTLHQNYEMISYLFSNIDGGIYKRSILVKAEQVVSKFKNLSEDEKAIVLFYLIYMELQFDIDTSKDSSYLSEFISKLISICNRDDVDLDYLDFIGNNYRDTAINSTNCLSTLKHYKVTPTQINNKAHLLYYEYSNQCQHLCDEYFVVLWSKGDPETMVYLSKFYKDKLTKFKSSPLLYTKEVIFNLDHLDYEFIEAIIPNTDLSLMLSSRKLYIQFRSLDHIKKYKILDDNLKHCIYTPLQIFDLDIVAFYLNNLPSYHYKIDILKSIMVVAIEKMLLPIIDYLLNQIQSIITQHFRVINHKGEKSYPNPLDIVYVGIGNFHHFDITKNTLVVYKYQFYKNLLLSSSNKNSAIANHIIDAIMKNKLIESRLGGEMGYLLV